MDSAARRRLSTIRACFSAARVCSSALRRCTLAIRPCSSGRFTLSQRLVPLKKRVYGKPSYHAYHNECQRRCPQNTTAICGEFALLKESLLFIESLPPLFQAA